MPLETAIAKYFEPTFEMSPCESCFNLKRNKNEQEISTTKSVAVFPKVLVIELEVFDDRGNLIQDEYFVPEQLDLTQFLKDSETGQALYKLSAVIGLTGETQQDCSYYCLTKRKQNGQDTWLEFQGDDFGEIGREDVFETEVVGHVLFYTKQ